MTQVTSQHPQFDACLPEVTNALSDILLELILHASASDYGQIRLTRIL